LLYLLTNKPQQFINKLADYSETTRKGEVIHMNAVKIDTGYISGTIIGEPGNEIHIFRGIPYAAPPVGDLRWKPPQPVIPWSGIYECTAFSLNAPQLIITLPSARPNEPFPFSTIPQSENCLYLNVLTPTKKKNENLPVMVWMHGGGFMFGSGNELLYNTPRLPQHGVVLVSVNMRLGPIGLLAHPLLSKESPDGVSGNYMFLDMIAALKWVQKNITAFGGDPDNVTIFGVSGGSAKVITLMTSPLTKGLFRRIIAESGSPHSKPLKELEEIGEKVFSKLGINEGKDSLKIARTLPWQKIIEAEQTLIKELHVTGRGGLWDTAVDGWFMPDDPHNIFKAGKQHKIDYILGANMGELNIGTGTEIIPGYLGLFPGAGKTGCKAYAYIFDQVPRHWRQDGCPSTHAMEVPYVFGDWDNNSGTWSRLFTMYAGLAGAKSEDPGLTDTDKNVSAMMMTMWTNFAKTGNPSIKGMINWPAYEEPNEQYLYIAERLELRSGYSKIMKR